MNHMNGSRWREEAPSARKPTSHDEACASSGDDGGSPRFRKSLRNANINYRNGWFFVTFQVAHNKSILGAIVGDRCELYVLRHADEIWGGDLSPNGMLSAMLKAFGR